MQFVSENTDTSRTITSHHYQDLSFKILSLMNWVVCLVLVTNSLYLVCSGFISLQSTRMCCNVFGSFEISCQIGTLWLYRKKIFCFKIVVLIRAAKVWNVLEWKVLYICPSHLVPDFLPFKLFLQVFNHPFFYGSQYVYNGLAVILKEGLGCCIFSNLIAPLIFQNLLWLGTHRRAINLFNDLNSIIFFSFFLVGVGCVLKIKKRITKKLFKFSQISINKTKRNCTKTI